MYGSFLCNYLLIICCGGGEIVVAVVVRTPGEERQDPLSRYFLDATAGTVHIEGKLQENREQHRQALLEVKRLTQEIELLEGYKRTMLDATEVARILTSKPTGGWRI